MNASLLKRKSWTLFATILISCISRTSVSAAEIAPIQTHRSIVLWDTLSPLAGKTDLATQKWRAVPDDLMLLEKDPAKAGSDPGYYGREYAFQGDAVVQTPALTAVFSSAKGVATVFAKSGTLAAAAQSSGPGIPEPLKIAEISPGLAGEAAPKIHQVEILRNADDRIALRVSFSSAQTALSEAVFSFDRTGIVEIKPARNMKSVRLTAEIQYGIVPAFIGDDLIFDDSRDLGTNLLAVPSENMFVGLLKEENAEFVLTWPKAKQRLSLQLQGEGSDKSIQSVILETDSQPLYLAALTAPGIWHRQALGSDFLEKDVKIDWKRPFPARWKTQLLEEDLPTTFAFRESKGEIWRGVAGSYVYPVWFDGEEAFYHLGKKVQPKGDSLIYCLEGRDTPLSALTPADILEQSLGRPAAATILDFAGRKLRTHHRRGATGVRRACTCGCTEAIQAVFAAGEEVSSKEYIQGALNDMIYFVHRHVERIDEYRTFVDRLLKELEAKKIASPELKPFLESLEEIARQIPQECEVQKENMKTFGYADELAQKTMALTAKKDSANLQTYMELLKAWRAMGGAQDYVVAKCHVITRNLCQTAGYQCAALPEAVPMAEQVRAECRQVLRNPDGYEIWADY